MTLMTLAEYGRRRGVTRQAISRFVRYPLHPFAGVIGRA
jgi:hypothetical protein